jgi:hypothetical protein
MQGSTASGESTFPLQYSSANDSVFLKAGLQNKAPAESPHRQSEDMGISMPGITVCAAAMRVETSTGRLGNDDYPEMQKKSFEMACW